MSKATRGFYDTDGAGQEFITSEVDQEIVDRLLERGYDREEMDSREYDEIYEKELSEMIEQAEDDYADFLADQQESAFEDREYWDNRPGGRADYIYG